MLPLTCIRRIGGDIGAPCCLQFFDIKPSDWGVKGESFKTSAAAHGHIAEKIAIPHACCNNDDIAPMKLSLCRDDKRGPQQVEIQGAAGLEFQDLWPAWHIETVCNTMLCTDLAGTSQRLTPAITIV